MIGPEILLICAVAAVGVLHTIVPDHWVPITLLARQQQWTRQQTARAALGAGTGHVVSTLIIGIIVWAIGLAFAARLGHFISLVSSLALISFGGWIAITSWREKHIASGHGHSHSHDGKYHHDGHTYIQAEKQEASSRMALLLILGSSPMVEGIPAFFAAGKYGAGLIAVMALVFAVATIATYVLLCVYSTARLQRIKLGKFEEYGEVLSGACIALVGAVFAVWPMF